MPPAGIEEIEDRSQAGEHSVLIEVLVEKLPEMPELRPHQQPDRVLVWRFAVDLGEKINGLSCFAVHKLLAHRLGGASVAAAEKEGAFVVVLGEQTKIDTLLYIYGADNILGQGAFFRPLVFLRGRREYFLHSLKKVLKQAYKQLVLILITRVYSAADTKRK